MRGEQGKEGVGRAEREGTGRRSSTKIADFNKQTKKRFHQCTSSSL
jgi:hypothetical protein